MEAGMDNLIVILCVAAVIAFAAFYLLRHSVHVTRSYRMTPPTLAESSLRQPRPRPRYASRRQCP